jgi:Zn-finger nucleic acid-binding protein
MVAIMKCPNCEIHGLTAFNLNGVQVHTCHSCHGFWITKNELEKIKDKIPDDAWVDLDLWNDKEKSIAKQSKKVCPVCNVSLYSFDWDNSHVIVDMCKKCNGIWLGRGEFEKAVQYIKDTADSEILDEYGKTLETKIKEVFTGPHHVIKEIHDVLTLLNMFQYKLLVQHPKIAQDLINIPAV